MEHFQFHNISRDLLFIYRLEWLEIIQRFIDAELTIIICFVLLVYVVGVEFVILT